ncbi:unnamed protein product [Rotaria sp. Silwood2]|nr:unnamed protein product [Rotaria sp. Silwood2]CAF2666607.1 unnamed protein product [Rotaria sp. Silwood2]CAF2942677.1 unnamed protein product [Rotaria sp. Silwood2]CAF3397648.1 unnamed protein product [Rotaria sp. Silwood2]CAF4059698.1 unnamed protein product [Rotaria sp. Silwood2]
MWHDEHVLQLNFTSSQYNLLGEIKTILDISSTRDSTMKKKEQLPSQPVPVSKNDQSQEQQLVQRINILEQCLHDMDKYEEQLIAFCGLWEDYPHNRYRMEFCIEMGQLIGYSNINNSKALASYDGRIINMIIVYPKETGRSLDHYRGRLGWNRKYIVWEKEDSSRESGWRSTRRWIKIE